VKKENVIGRAILTIPYVGYLGYFVRTPIGFTLLIIIPAILLIIMEIRNIIKELRKQNRDEMSHHKGGKANAGKAPSFNQRSQLCLTNSTIAPQTFMKNKAPSLLG